MNATTTRLAAVTKDLWAKWQYTRESWTDTKSLEFERKYLQELMASVDKTVTVMEELDKLLTKIKSDCE
jgi:Cdc6-like AAA superfamily ATPase